MIRTTAAFSVLMLCASTLLAHCQVPCGIYGDQMRFEGMLEDCKTIGKAQVTLHKMAAEEFDAQAINQAARWVMTKEDHATKIQETIAAYFMAQRLKADGDGYEKKLKAAHAVMVAAMKCKQSADPAESVALEKSILDFYRAYEGKEPKFEHEG